MSTKEDGRRVGLHSGNRVAPLLKTVGGKSRNPTATTKKRKSDHTPASDSDDPTNGDIKSQFDRGKKKSENDEPAYVAGSYKGTAFRRGRPQRPPTAPVPEQKPKFKSYAPIASKKPTFNDYGAGKKPMRSPSPVLKPIFKTYAPTGSRPKKPVFKTYGDSRHSSSPSSDEQIYLSSQSEKRPSPPTATLTATPPNETKCPMCGTYVPLSLLLDFASSFPSVDPFAMRIQVQSRFCSHHRRHAAASSADYPSIEWLDLPSRVRAHLPSIRAFLNDPDSAEPSYYRNVLAKDIVTGRNRTLIQGIMSEAGARVRVPGYYGPRGARVMQEEILDVLSGELREAAVRDVVVGGRGVSAYVTSVLVLEVGILLVMDDLGLGKEDARGVMEKSAAWGTLVNEELDEEAPEAAEESDEYDW